MDVRSAEGCSTCGFDGEVIWRIVMRRFQPLQGFAQLDAEVIDLVPGDLDERTLMPLWYKPNFTRSLGGKRDERKEMPALVHDAFVELSFEFDFLAGRATACFSVMLAGPISQKS